MKQPLAMLFFNCNKQMKSMYYVPCSKHHWTNAKYPTSTAKVQYMLIYNAIIACMYCV